MAYYKIESHTGDGTGKTLNVAATGPISSRTTVNILDDGCTMDQIWSISSLGKNQEIKTINNPTYMLNAKISSTGTTDCDVMTSNADTTFNFEKITGSIYYIRLVSNTSLYLTASSYTSKSNVIWDTLGTTASTKKAQQWKVTMVSLPEVYTRTNGAGHDTLGEEQMETNASYIYSYLTDMGFSKNAICAILGNMQRESTLNPASWQVQDNLSYGYGLCQWDDGSNFTNWAKNKKIISSSTASAVNTLAYSNPVKLMDAELDFLWERMQTSDWFKPSNNQSKYGTSETLSATAFKTSTKSVETLTRIFCGHYERPGEPAMTIRVNAAKKWYNFL